MTFTMKDHSIRFGALNSHCQNARTVKADDGDLHTLGEESTVEHVHTFHNGLCSSAEDVHIYKAGIIQNKTNGMIITFPHDILTTLTAASLDDFGSCHN